MNNNLYPQDFISWEAILAHTEAIYHRMPQQEQEQGRDNLFKLYDDFLALYPLCFGYWKKYINPPI